jgi:hypothetical protein
MIGPIFTFAIVFAIFYIGINAVRATSGKEKLMLTKVLAYSIICAVLATSVLVGFVIIF